MAVALDATTGFYPTNSWSTTARSFSHTVSGTNRYLTVAVYLYQGAGQTATSVTYAGVDMSLLGAAQAGGVRAELWGLKAPATGANNVSVQLSAGTNGACAVARSWTDVDQTTPTGSAVAATGSSTSPSVAVTSAAGELVIDACAVLSQTGTAPTATAGTGQSQDSNNYTGFSTQDVFGLASNKAGATSTTMAWTLNVSRPWATTGIALKPVGGGGTVPLGISGVGVAVSTAVGTPTVTGGVVSGQKYVSTSGSDSNSGSSSSPWRTIDHAVMACANNTTINVGAGTYAKTVLANVIKSGVVVQPAGAVTVTHGGWDFDNTKGITWSRGTGTWLVTGTTFGMTMDGTCQDIVFDGITNDDYRSGQWQVSQQTGGMSNITFRNCSWADIDASPHFVTNPNSNGPCMLAIYNRTTSPRDILIEDCSWANTIGCDSIQLSAARGTKADGEAHRLTNVTIQRCNFNNVTAGSTPAHSDPIQLVGFTQGVTIRDNQFLQGTRGILCQPNSSTKHGDHLDLVFENNRFHGRTDFCISVWNCPGVSIINNTVPQTKRYSGTDTASMNTGIRLNYAWAGATGQPTSNVTLRNNIIDNLIVYEKGPGSTNNPQGTLTFASKGNNLINVIGGTYGDTAYALKTGTDADVRASNTVIDSQTFVNKTTGDLRLKAGSPAIGIGNHLVAPDTDADGVIRGNPPDAGALEFLDGTTVLSVRLAGISVATALGAHTVTTGGTPVQSVAAVGGISVPVTIGGAASVAVGPIGPTDPGGGTGVAGVASNSSRSMLGCGT